MIHRGTGSSPPTRTWPPDIRGAPGELPDDQPRPRGGKAWTVQYGKACADRVDELVAWAAGRTSGTPRGCGTCQPDVPESPSRPRGGASHSWGSRGVDRTPFELKLTGDSVTVTIRRVDGGPALVIEGAPWVAETFFRLDRSAVGRKSYGARVQSCLPECAANRWLQRTSASRWLIPTSAVTPHRRVTDPPPGLGSKSYRRSRLSCRCSPGVGNADALQSLVRRRVVRVADWRRALDREGHGSRGVLSNLWRGATGKLPLLRGVRSRSVCRGDGN